MGDTLYWASELNADLLAFIKRERPDRHCYIDSNGCVSVSDPRVGRWWLSSWRGRPSGQIVYMVDRVDPDPSVSLGGPDVRTIGQTLPGEPMEAIFRIQRFQDAPEPVVAPDLIDARERIAAMRAEALLATDERDDARRMLGECYVISGADTDGNGWEHLWRHAVENAHETRRLHDASTDELLAQVDGLRAEIAALTAAHGAPVDVHARAVQEAWRDALDMRGELNGADALYLWANSHVRRDLISALTPIVGADRALALVDGDADARGGA